MINDDNLLLIGYSITNLVESIQSVLSDEPKYGNIYIGLKAEHLREISDDLLAIQKRIERLSNKRGIK